MKNKLLQCHKLDNPSDILNCINFTYEDENTDDIATLIANGTQHNISACLVGLCRDHLRRGIDHRRNAPDVTQLHGGHAFFFQ